MSATNPPPDDALLRTLVEDLEARLDPAVEDELEDAWRGFLAGRRAGEPFFAPRRARAAPPGVAWPNVAVADTFGGDRFAAMAVEQLAGVSWRLAEGAGGALGVRSNFGVSILPSLFGAEVVQMDAKLGLLPTCRALPGGVAAIRRLADAPPPSPDRGLGPRVLETARRFRALFADYPKVRRYVRQYHPDLQGPLDALELLWGSDLFVGLYDEPELAARALDRIADAYEILLDAWLAEAGPWEPDMNPHWSWWWPGRIVLRDDSAMNLSPAMYAEFALPWNRRLLDRYGSGGLHACGRVEHWLPVAAELKNMTAFNMSQPEYNDMETVFRHTVDRGVFLLGLRRDAAEAAAKVRDLRGRVHVG